MGSSGEIKKDFVNFETQLMRPASLMRDYRAMLMFKDHIYYAADSISIKIRERYAAKIMKMRLRDFNVKV